MTDDTHHLKTLDYLAKQCNHSTGMLSFESSIFYGFLIFLELFVNGFLFYQANHDSQQLLNNVDELCMVTSDFHITRSSWNTVWHLQTQRISVDLRSARWRKRDAIFPLGCSPRQSAFGHFSFCLVSHTELKWVGLGKQKGNTGVTGVSLGLSPQVDVKGGLILALFLAHTFSFHTTLLSLLHALGNRGKQALIGKTNLNRIQKRFCLPESSKSRAAPSRKVQASKEIPQPEGQEPHQP